MAHDSLDPLDAPLEGEAGIDERAGKLLEESDGNEDPDTED